MSKLDEIFDRELSTTIRFQKGEAVGCTIYGLDRAKEQIKQLFLELVDYEARFRSPEDELDRGIQIGYDTLASEFRQKVEEL